MNQVMQRYDALLIALFDASKPAPVPAACHARFIAERNRRLLSVGRTMSRYWPRTLRFEQAMRGRTFIESVAAEIPLLIHEASTMEDAVETAGLRWHRAADLPASRELFRFEQSQRNMRGMGGTVPTRPERAMLKKMGVARPLVLDFSMDVLALARSVSYLESSAASAEHFAGIVPPPQPIRLAFGQHNGKRVVVVLPREA
ncbi:hypothetical protein [Burkholderia ambifaria]|uniref:hypothetical protein n=1 Tax=Burkholderia ambifaria TaxID=152480 RepID=UPI00158D00BE|nr:hypothetical protein [Burkholderia ambifaria]